MKTAVIAGSSGLTGKQLMYKLLESNFYSRIIVAVRKEMPVKHSKLEQVVVDFNKLGDFKDKLKGEDYFCCLGTTMKKAGGKEEFYKVDYTYCLEFAKLTEENGGKKFLLISAAGSHPDSSFFYSAVKGKLEEAVKRLSIAEIHIFRPSLLSGNRLEARPGERIGIAVARLLSPLMAGSLSQYKLMEVTKLTEAMISASVNKFPDKVNIWQYNEIMLLLEQKREMNRNDT